jgi:hypothetical protein
MKAWRLMTSAFGGCHGFMTSGAIAGRKKCAPEILKHAWSVVDYAKFGLKRYRKTIGGKKNIVVM